MFFIQKIFYIHFSKYYQISRKLEDEKIVENWKNIKILKWEYIQNHEFSSIENQTWVEQEESRLVQKETNEALTLKNSLITDLDTLKTKVVN